ncbi:MAG: serine/threonine protein kinase, partial [Leptolyngbya sp.]|nr:serine/threonine protein kinase [Candidatus Melainabacteria bacterium]
MTEQSDVTEPSKLDNANASTHHTTSEQTLVNHRIDKYVGTIIDKRYELLSMIGQGGMSVVYKATDKKLGKFVAIKLLLPHLVSDPILFMRFQQEEKAASSLSHPNIVAIHDFGATENQEPYIVMDYLDGTPLNDAIKMLQVLAIERSVVIFSQIADALHHAHDNNILHRDLKPSNVLLLHQGPHHDLVKIVDFGIAKLIPQDGGESLHLTKTGEVFGSPFYMSPEQCKGEKLDCRSDIYSAGCLMYEVLGGKPPVAGANLMETLYKQLSEIPKSFSSTCPDRKIPEELEAIVFKSLHKDPSMRYQTMADLKRDLDDFLNKIEAGWFTRAKFKIQLLRLKVAPFVGREKKLLVVTAAAVAITACSFALYANIYLKDVSEPPPSAALAWSIKQPSAIESDHFTSAASAAKRVLKSFAASSGLESGLYLEQLDLLARLFESNGHYPEALEYREQAFKSLRKIDGANGAETLQAQLNYATTMRKSGDLLGAIKNYEEVFQLAPVDDLARKHAVQFLAETNYSAGRYGQAAKFYEQVLSGYSPTEKSSVLQLLRATTLCRLADCYRLTGEFHRAEELYEIGRNLLRANCELTDPRIFSATRLLGYVHYQQEHYKRARYLYEEALPQMESALGAANPEVVAAL